LVNLSGRQKIIIHNPTLPPFYSGSEPVSNYYSISGTLFKQDAAGKYLSELYPDLCGIR
jgi:hypothetical protein